MMTRDTFKPPAVEPAHTPANVRITITMRGVGRPEVEVRRGVAGGRDDGRHREDAVRSAVPLLSYILAMFAVIVSVENATMPK